ncbi:hypothetical protein GALL_137110 [mine drainage metagenome]|uniref:Uncharacterized protein n=1 Tax=mine drainage metagenome TaxID=410659 RepID=A0A1J5SJB2_9ZZZZ
MVPAVRLKFNFIFTDKMPASMAALLTLPGQLTYSSFHLQIRHTHIAPHARYEAHRGIPRTRLAQGIPHNREDR